MRECSKCKNITDEYYKNYNICKICSRSRAKEWRINNKEKVSLYNKIYREKNIDYHENWKRDNEGYMEEYQLNWRSNNSFYNKEYSILRKKNDPIFKERCKIYQITRNALFSKKWHKDSNYFKVLGCHRDELIKSFEDKFKDGMSWSNYGDWEIDHIIPLSEASTVEELYKLSIFTNLQPLWVDDNRRKKRLVKKTEYWDIKNYNIKTQKKA